jgi:beta-glucanase (GH16 family)
MGTSNYTSARMITKGKYSLQHGKVEAKIKLPIGPGTWPAFWMLGDNISTVSWPACGEIDIMEHVNSETKIYGTIHYDSVGHRYYGGTKACDVTNWHVYGLEWNATKLMWFLDGVKYYETTINAARSELNNPFYFLLNVAIGGNWPGGPNQFTQFPAEMLVDFIRVYKPALGTDELTASMIELVPNPADQTIQLISDFSNESFTNGQLWSMEGRFVQTIDFQSPIIAIQHLEKGTYFISFEVNGKQVVKQFLKQ